MTGEASGDGAAVHDLAALHAVGALDGGDDTRYADHLRGCAACRREVAALRETLARVSDLVAEPPPATRRAAVLAAIATQPQVATDRTRPAPLPDVLPPPAALAPPTPPRPTLAAGPEPPSAAPEPDHRGHRGHRGRRWIAPVLAAAALVAAAVLGWGWTSSRKDLDRAKSLTTVLAAPDATTIELTGDGPGAVRLVYSPELQRSVVVAAGLDDVPDERAYALWFLGDKGPEPITLFRTQDGQATQVLERTPEGYKAVGVTEEPAGGSPQPTGPVLLSANL